MWLWPLTLFSQSLPLDLCPLCQLNLMWLASWRASSTMKIKAMQEGWRRVTGGVLCGHGSTIRDQLLLGLRVFWGYGVEISFSSRRPSTVPGVCFVLGFRSAVVLFQAIRLFSLSFLFSPHCLTGGARHSSSTLCGPPLIYKIRPMPFIVVMSAWQAYISTVKASASREIFDSWSELLEHHCLLWET